MEPSRKEGFRFRQIQKKKHKKCRNKQCIENHDENFVKKGFNFKILNKKNTNRNVNIDKKKIKKEIIKTIFIIIFVN